jgi:CRISPR system Cascade subunit CasA
MKEFNLLYEKWLLAMTSDGKTEALSLIEIFRRAPELRSLAGELPTQDIAVLRLLLAILHAALGGRDIDGNELPDSEDDKIDGAFALWGALWERGAFPCERIEHYLEEYKERFWLFHDKTPFYQVAGMDAGTTYGAQKLNGMLSESGSSLGNVQKARLFPQITGSARKLEFAEAARWLLYVNAFDDTSSKPKGKNLPSPGAGWLGKLGLVAAEGNNLFETLMLNFVLLPDGEDKLWDSGKPNWEMSVRAGERIEISPPQNQAALLTLQSRRLLLLRENDKVIGFLLLGGDFFQRENAFVEQMTMWRNGEKKENAPPVFVPRRHDPSRQLWRSFASLAVEDDTTHRPGIVSWLFRLRDEKILKRNILKFTTPAVKYGDKDFFVDDVFSDSLSFNAAILETLEDAEKGWTQRIIQELKVTEKWAYAVGELAAKIAKASGGDGAGERNSAREQAYFRLDMPFRRWLERIDPAQDDMDNKSRAWHKEAQPIIRRLGLELVKNAGMNAFVGRNGITSPLAYNEFLSATYLSEGGDKVE